MEDDPKLEPDDYETNVSYELVDRLGEARYDQVGPIVGGDGGGGDDGMSDLSRRVAVLEAHTDQIRTDIAEIRPTVTSVQTLLTKVDTRMDALATKEDLSGLKSGLSGLQGKLDSKLGFWQFVVLMSAGAAILVGWDQLRALFGIVGAN